MPDSPSSLEHILGFRGEHGIPWGFTSCIDFWSIVLRTMKTEPVPGSVQIADEDMHKIPLMWIDRRNDGDGWYAELSGIALELIRLHGIAEVVQTGEYSAQKRRRDLRTAMSYLNWKPGGFRFPGVGTKSSDAVLLPVPAVHDYLILQQGVTPVSIPDHGFDREERDEGERQDTPNPFEDLSDSMLQSVDNQCEERVNMFQTLAKETYQDAVSAMEPLHQDQLDPEFVEWRARELAIAIAPPVLQEPELETRISKRWARANAWGRELMGIASTEESIAALDAQIVTLAVMKDDLARQHVEALKRKEAEEVRRRKLEEILGETDVVRAEIDTLYRQVEESVKDATSVGPKMDLGKLNALWAKRDAMMRRGVDCIAADIVGDLRARKAAQAGPSTRPSSSTTLRDSGSELASSPRPSGSTT